MCRCHIWIIITYFIIFMTHFYVGCVCMLHECRCWQGSEEGGRSPGAGVTGSTHVGTVNRTTGPLQEQQLPLTAEIFHQSYSLSICIKHPSILGVFTHLLGNMREVSIYLLHVCRVMLPVLKYNFSFSKSLH